MGPWPHLRDSDTKMPIMDGEALWDEVQLWGTGGASVAAGYASLTIR